MQRIDLQMRVLAIGAQLSQPVDNLDNVIVAGDDAEPQIAPVRLLRISRADEVDAQIVHQRYRQHHETAIDLSKCMEDG